MRSQEEAVLLAALDGNRDEVLGRLRKFLPGERRNLVRACHLISGEILALEDEPRAEPAGVAVRKA